MFSILRPSPSLVAIAQTSLARRILANGAATSTSHNLLRSLATKRSPAYKGHIPLNAFENAFLAVGSAVMALANPRRGDMVAALGETTAGPSIVRLRDFMLESAEGRRVLKQRPRVNSKTIDMGALAQYPEGSFARAYIDWLNRCGVTPDTREPVHYIDDPELAYVMQRYRECHDFYHCITSLPVRVEYEVALKYFEFANLGLPMTLLSAIFGPLRLNGGQRTRLFKEYVPWALRCGASAKSLISVFWEERWAMNVEDLKKELGIWDPPEADWGRPLSEAKAAARKAAAVKALEPLRHKDIVHSLHSEKRQPSRLRSY